MPFCVMLDYEYGSSNFDNNFQQSMSLSSKLAIPYLESESIQNGRKREIEFNNDPTTASDERNKNKRKKLLTSFEQSHRSSQEITETKDFRVWDFSSF
ncbi:hypothetical protein Gohar_000230 [Gossypium harknessii]|uniref:Uncharacterized protein n=1 Tax=Gossypium harknessii TaxID=34285 RepID=A0A7J9I011_9ROSI|nr:hypothetical protein [Gossypium harknessii]